MNINVKRAGTNVGIGRELYTPLFIWINGLAENDKFKVSEIGYNDKREIDKLKIVNDKGIQAFKLGSFSALMTEQEHKQETPTTEQPTQNDSNLKCSECDENISEKVNSFSATKYGKALCMKCQKLQK